LHFFRKQNHTTVQPLRSRADKNMTARRPKTKTPNSNPTGRLPAADSQKKLSYNRTTI